MQPLRHRPIRQQLTVVILLTSGIVLLLGDQPGVSSVTVPVQGQNFVNSQWSDYSGTFNQPIAQQGAFVAEFNLKSLITPIPFLGMEGAVQLDPKLQYSDRNQLRGVAITVPDQGSLALLKGCQHSPQIFFEISHSVFPLPSLPDGRGDGSINTLPP